MEKEALLKIIGCGNRDRGDDQAGILVAQRLRDTGIETDIHNGDALALLEKWRADEDVILVDAVLTGAPPGTLHVWESSQAESDFRPAATSAAVSSHGFDIARAIDLGRTLGKLPARLRVCGIEGTRFEQGAEVTPAVLKAIDLAVQKIQSMRSA